MRTRAWMLAATVAYALLALPAVASASAIAVSAVPITVTEGVPFTGPIAKFFYNCGGDPCPPGSAFTVPAGMTATQDAPGSNQYTVTGTIRIPDDHDQARSIDISDPDGDTERVQLAMMVKEAPISLVLQGVDVAPGDVVSGIVSYTDTGTIAEVRLDWGDGVIDTCTTTPVFNGLPEPDLNNPHVPYCAHIYHASGAHTVVASVLDDGVAVATASTTAVVEPLALTVSRQHLRAASTLSLSVRPTLAAEIRAQGRLVIPGERRRLLVSAPAVTAGNDQPTSLRIALTRRELGALRRALRRHIRPSLRLTISGLSQSGLDQVDRTVRLPFTR